MEREVDVLAPPLGEVERVARRVLAHADVEGDQEPAAGGDRAVQLDEAGAASVAVEMDDRVRRNRAGPLAVGHRKLREGAHREREPGVPLAGDADHAGRSVHSGRTQPQIGEVPGDVARSAAHVADRRPDADELGEEPVQRPVDRLARQLVADLVGVAAGDAVVAVVHGDHWISKGPLAVSGKGPSVCRGGSGVHLLRRPGAVTGFSRIRLLAHGDRLALAPDDRGDDDQRRDDRDRDAQRVVLVGRRSSRPRRPARSAARPGSSP